MARREMMGQIYPRHLMEAIEQPIAGIRAKLFANSVCVNPLPCLQNDVRILLEQGYSVQNNIFSHVLLKSPASGIIRVFVQCTAFFDIVGKHTP